VRWWNACAYYAISIAEGQRKLGHQVWVAGDPGFPVTNYAQQAGLPAWEISFSARNPFWYWLQYNRLYHFIRQHHIEIINAHRPEDHLLAALLCKKTGIPLVRTVGDVRAPRQNILNRHLHEQLTGFIIFSSAANLTRYQSCWPDIERKSAVIHGGVNLGIFKPREKNVDLLTKLGLTENKIILGQIGRLSTVKDFPTTIKAMALLREERPDIQLIISGIEDKVTSAHLKELACAYDIDRNITFIGRYDPVEDLISILDIGIIASKGSEAICRIAMEYLAMGIPVVATDVNVLPEIIIDRRNGLIIPAEDPVSMAEAIAEIINNPGFRELVKLNNLEDSRTRVNILTAAEATIGVYQKLIENKQKLLLL
jgi:glycosyltransferase involved in cell wall biosynthesis